MSASRIIRVAAAAICNSNNEILLAQRPSHKHQGDLWEFPGGKIEPEESDESALVRELQEELDITARQYRRLIQIRHDYGDKHVELNVFLVNAYDGKPHGKEGQPLAWVARDRLRQYAMPAADVPIVNSLLLPETLLITPNPESAQATHVKPWLMQLERALQNGISFVQLRAHEFNRVQYRVLAEQTYELCNQYRAQLVLNRHPEEIADLNCHAWHLTGRNAAYFHNNKLPERADRWLAVSCHNADALIKAAHLGADFALLSPVKATASHVDTQGLGWSAFSEAVARVNLPVYALGGMTKNDANDAYAHGAQGVAAMRAFWPQ